MAVYTRPHKRKLIKRSRTLPVYGEGADKGKYFRCWNCGWICNVDRDELGDSDSSAGDEHTDYHETHHCSTYDVYKDGNEGALGPELINNASFETSNPPADWTAYRSADLDRHADPHTGTYCLEVNEAGETLPHAGQTINVDTGKQYRATCYVKAGTTALYKFYVWDVQNNADITPFSSGSATAAFVQKIVDVTIPSGCASVIVSCQNNIATFGGGETILYDDVSFRRIIHAPRPASRYAVLGGDTGHYQVAQNIVTPDGEAELVRHKYISDISRGCPFCGSVNYRGDY